MSVRVTSPDPDASTPVEASLDDGRAVVPVTFGSMGAWTLTVSDLTDISVAPMTSAPISVLGSAPDFVIDPIPSPVTAGEPVPVTIRCVAPDGALLDGYDGYAMLAADTGPETISPPLIQFVGGVWSGEVTFFAASANMAFSCVDFVAPPNIGSSEPFVVLPGAFAGLQVLLPGQRPVGGRDPGFTGDARAPDRGRGVHGRGAGRRRLVESRVRRAGGRHPRRSPIPSRSHREAHGPGRRAARGGAHLPAGAASTP